MIISVNNAPKEMAIGYTGVNGVPKQIKEMYGGDADGRLRLIYSLPIEVTEVWAKYNAYETMYHEIVPVNTRYEYPEGPILEGWGDFYETYEFDMYTGELIMVNPINPPYAIEAQGCYVGWSGNPEANRKLISFDDVEILDNGQIRLTLTDYGFKTYGSGEYYSGDWLYNVDVSEIRGDVLWSSANGKQIYVRDPSGELYYYEKLAAAG